MFLKNVLKFNTSLFKKNRNVNKYESKPDLSNLDGNWKNLLIHCDHEYSHIISDMLKKQQGISQDSAIRKSKTETYLSEKLSHILNFNFRKKAPVYQLALLTIALRKTKDGHGLKQLKSRALDMYLFHLSEETERNSLSLSNKQDYPQIDSWKSKINLLQEKDIQFLISQLSESFVETIDLQKQRHTKAKYKLKLFNILQDFKPSLNSMNILKKIIQMLAKMTSEVNMVNKFRLSRAVQMIDEKVQKLIDKQPNLVKNVTLYESNNGKFSFQFFVTLLKCINFCEYQSIPSEKKYLQIVLRDDFLSNEVSTHQKVKFYLKMYYDCHSYFDENFKNPIREKLKYLYETSSLTKKAINETQSYFQIVFFDNMLKSKMYFHYLQMKSEVIDGHIVIKELPPKPELDSFELALLKKHQSEILSREYVITGLLISTYPEVLNDPNVQQKTIQKQNLYLDNEHAARLQLALKQLGISYEKQQRILGKKVDYVLPGNIVLECDGDAHIDYKRLNVSQATAFRNVLMIYGGYRLVIIENQQLNSYRTVAGLKQIIQKKLSILQQNKAYLIE